MLKLSDFDYNLPKELIAQYPLKERDAAKLLVLDRKKGTMRHCVFRNILDYFEKEDLMILNNTKVLPARLDGFRLTHSATPQFAGWPSVSTLSMPSVNREINIENKHQCLPSGYTNVLTGGKVEVLLLGSNNGNTFRALIKPSRVKVGEKIIFDDGKITGVVNAKNEITFSAKDTKRLYNLGVMPLPPYIKRKPEDLDFVYYQTVYAKVKGAIASPTAGLHFTKRFIEEIKSFGVHIAYITLHVGLGTFRPVKAEDVSQHKMASEYFKIPENTIHEIEKARKNRNRIFAVGTTSLRALETYYFGRKEGYTDLFIYPGYEFNLVDCLLTNFHLPRTTLFMLVCAFAQEKLIKRAYQEAIDKKYRFYSYGDAMLII